MSQDRELFNDTMLEGEYTTWTRLWSLNYGAAANLRGVTVDNKGNVYVTDGLVNTSYTITRAGVSTTRVGNWFLNYADGYRASHYCTLLSPSSATGKYMLSYISAVPDRIVVWRYGAIIYTINYQVLLADADAPGGAAISSNGRYVALLLLSVATGNVKYVQLFEGR